MDTRSESSAFPVRPFRPIRRSMAARWHLARSLLGGNRFYLAHRGHCPCCQRNTTFRAFDAWLRDEFRCDHCSSIPRQRALMRVVEQHYPDWRSLVVHESSPSAGGASRRLQHQCPGYQASQFFPGEPVGKVINGFRNENLEQLTLADESVDLVITQDVIEHIYRPERVFSEIARVLKPGGAHVFTVPLINKHAPTQVWATQQPDGSPAFLHEPEFHGNPVNPEGSPVTMHWGFDIVDHIREATGLTTTIIALDDLQFGIRAEYVEVLLTQKPPHRIPPSV